MLSESGAFCTTTRLRWGAIHIEVRPTRCRATPALNSRPTRPAPRPPREGAEGSLRDGDDGLHLIELCYDKNSPPPPNARGNAQQVPTTPSLTWCMRMRGFQERLICEAISQVWCQFREIGLVKFTPKFCLKYSFSFPAARQFPFLATLAHPYLSFCVSCCVIGQQSSISPRVCWEPSRPGHASPLEWQPPHQCCNEF